MTPIRVAAALLALGAPSALAQGSGAQTNSPPAAIGNRANGLSYQPTLGGVTAREQSAGVRPSPSQLSSEDKELDRINRQLLGPKATPPVAAPAR